MSDCHGRKGSDAGGAHACRERRLGGEFQRDSVARVPCPPMCAVRAVRLRRDSLDVAQIEASHDARFASRHPDHRARCFGTLIGPSGDPLTNREIGHDPTRCKRFGEVATADLVSPLPMFPMGEIGQLGVSGEFWMLIQASFDLEEARGKALKDLARIERESASRLAGTGGREPQINSVRRRQSRAAMF
mgnify:FL=1